jgi:undecaprenyl diphosphate synthase
MLDSSAYPHSNHDQVSITLPAHIAVIMDGNGRWASQQGKNRISGHQQGAETVRMIVEESRKIGIKYLTLFSFSSENWSRPSQEVQALMSLLQYHLKFDLQGLIENGIRFRCIGRRETLPSDVNIAIQEAEKQTAKNSEMTLVLAISYGGRQEIVDAAIKFSKHVAEGTVSPAELDEKMFSSYLYAPDIPDPDLLIRTSSELRISNFLLWELAYSEIVISSKCWPEFTVQDYYTCLEDYSKRLRKFGKTKEQVLNSEVSKLPFNR